MAGSVLGTRTQMMKPSWSLQCNDPGTLHFVINEEVEDQRRKMMTLCVCVEGVGVSTESYTREKQIFTPQHNHKNKTKQIMIHTRI